MRGEEILLHEYYFSGSGKSRPGKPGPVPAVPGFLYVQPALILERHIFLILRARHATYARNRAETEKALNCSGHQFRVQLLQPIASSGEHNEESLLKRHNGHGGRPELQAAHNT